MKLSQDTMPDRAEGSPSHRRRLRILPLAICVSMLSFALGELPASAQKPSNFVPSPRITILSSKVRITAKKGQLERSSFVVRNERSCSVDVDTRNMTRHGVIVQCPRGRLGPKESMTCEVKLVDSTVGKFSQQWSARGYVEPDCKRIAYAKVDKREKSEAAPWEKKLASMKTNDEVERDWDEKRKSFRKAQEEKLTALEKKLKGMPEKHREKIDKVEAIWDEASREMDRRIDRQEKKLKLARLDNSALDAVDAEIRETQVKAANNIDRMHAAKIRDCDQPSRIRVQKQQAYDDLTTGAYHDKCDRTASEILREDGQTLTQHLGEWGGEMIPAPQSVIDKRMADFDKKIAEAQKQCGNATRAHEAATKSWIARVRKVQAKREKVEAKRASVLANIQAEIDKLKENARTSEFSHIERVDALHAKHRDEIRELKLEIANLKDAQRAEREEFEQKREEAIRKHWEKRSEIETKIRDIKSVYDSIRAQIYSAHLKKSRAEILIQTEITP